VYSIDEVFIDATEYLHTYKQTAREFAMRLILDVMRTTGITATAGIGTNLYLCKVAMDIDAKHIQPDENGVRISELNERSCRERLWEHRPLTDFWRVGRGYAKKLEANGMFTMGDIAAVSLCNEDKLYKLFGVTPSCSSIMPGAGSLALSRTLKRISPAATASAPGRCCNALIPGIKPDW